MISGEVVLDSRMPKVMPQMLVLKAVVRPDIVRVPVLEIPRLAQLTSLVSKHNSALYLQSWQHTEKPLECTRSFGTLSPRLRQSITVTCFAHTTCLEDRRRRQPRNQSLVLLRFSSFLPPKGKEISLALPSFLPPSRGRPAPQPSLIYIHGRNNLGATSWAAVKKARRLSQVEAFILKEMVGRQIKALGEREQGLLGEFLCQSVGDNVQARSR